MSRVIKYYVYQHVHPITKETVYIGKGCGDRAWVMRPKMSGGRSTEHLEWMYNLETQGFTPNDWVKIIVKGETKAEALKLEIKLIDAVKPKYNKNYDWGNCIFNEDDVKKMKALREEGKSYQEIANTMKCATMTVHRTLNNRSKGYQKWN